jgi:hypothetical protein
VLVTEHERRADLEHVAALSGASDEDPGVA